MVFYWAHIDLYAFQTRRGRVARVTGHFQSESGGGQRNRDSRTDPRTDPAARPAETTGHIGMIRLELQVHR